ncbi:MAG: alpha/beta fold hydrolase [Streptosporangiaceae bacterium]|jgi:pimeloyl-ACP methyl ester carboxylesterase
MAEFAELFPRARLVIQAGAGHFPWLDDARRFVATTAAFLA